LDLLYRGTRDGFAQTTFHQFCDNKGPTITVARIKDTAELFGGYSPLNWNQKNCWFTTDKSFIFALGDDDLNGAVFSPVKNNNSASYNHANCGPTFGGTGCFCIGYNASLQTCCCGNNGNYKLPIRSTSGNFQIDEVEVFSVKTR